MAEASTTQHYPPALVFRAVACGAVAGAALWPFVAATGQAAATALLVALVVAWRAPRLKYTALVLIGLCTVVVRGAFMPARPAPDAFIGQQTFEGIIVEPPKAAERVTRYVVNPVGLKVGKVLVVAHPYPKLQFSQQVKFTCRVTEQKFFAYVNRGIYRECAFPEIVIIAPAEPSLRGWLFKWRDAAGLRLKQQLTEPYGSLTTGILWGDDAELPRDLVNDFRRTGTSHILAVSGFNVMVLTQILFTVLIGLGLWRRSASLIVVGVVAAFVVFTGAEPAVVRAGIMGSLLVLARFMGRRADRLNLLAGAAAVMLVAEPTLIRELGFQLSFAAMAGLMYVAPPLAERLRFLPAAFGLREAVAQTLAATVTTTPIVLVWLNQLPLTGIPANILIGPIVMLVFTLGLPLTALSFVAPALAYPFVLLITAVLWYVRYVIQSLATIPWAQAQLNLAYAWLAAAACAAAVAWFVYRNRRAVL